VSVSQPSLPPPGGEPQVNTFTTRAALTSVTRKLNSHRIRQVRTTSNPGCTGGYEISISITRSNARRTNLSAYDCANRTTGDIGGSLGGFLASIGLPLG
jgi:hypothetical protein